MIGDFDQLRDGAGGNKKLVEELAIYNLMNIATNSKFIDVMDLEDLNTLKQYLKLYVKYSSATMESRMLQMQLDLQKKEEEVANKREKLR